MALSLTDPSSQTWVFPAAAAADENSSSIWIPGYLELIGYEVSKAAEATTDHYEVSGSLDGSKNPNLADASITDWINAVHHGATADEWPASTGGALFVIFDANDRIVGPIRIRLRAATAAHAAIDQDGQVVTPLFRDVRRG